MDSIPSLAKLALDHSEDKTLPADKNMERNPETMKENKDDGLEMDSSTDESEQEGPARDSCKPASSFTSSHPPDSTPTSPPRVSFGVELEFLIAARPKRLAKKPDPDSHIPGLPPIFNSLGDQVKNSVRSVLKRNGIPVMRGFQTTTTCHGEDGGEGQQEVREEDHWEVKSEMSVSERVEGTYYWEPVEVTSPAFYAFDEAFDMVRVVVSIINCNFRCRVNQSCGFHVHVGNGKWPFDLRALRNFAALWWAAEPLLAVLHAPERMAGDWSASVRRTALSKLAAGEGERQAFFNAVEEPAYAARYYGRARKFGETTLPSALRHLNRKTHAHRTLLDGVMTTCDDLGRNSDEEDWKDEKAVPFMRPKSRGKFVENSKALEPTERQRCDIGLIGRLKLEQANLARGPPKIYFELPCELRSGSNGHWSAPSAAPYHTTSRDGSATNGLIHRQRTRIDNSSHKAPALTPAILARLPAHSRVNIELAQAALDAETGSGDTHMEQLRRWLLPRRDDTWSGAAELLACDVGLHQVQYLLEGGKRGNLRCEHYDKCLVAETSQSALGVHLAGGGRYTLEFREAGGSLDGEWVAAWARILCRLVEWARDVDASGLACVLGRIARSEDASALWGEVEYDVVDLLEDMGMPGEARLCEERARRGERAWYECVMLQRERPVPSWEEDGDIPEGEDGGSDEPW